MPSFKPKTDKEITTDVQRNITLDIKHKEYMKKFNEIWKQYEKTILQLKNKTDCSLVLTDLYYIKDQDYLKYHKIIKKWNDVLYEFCDKNNILIYKISTFVKDKKHFVNSLEPSKIGSKLIVDNIIKF